jgi:glycylpeptide N-tetradecanoyltransferase
VVAGKGGHITDLVSFYTLCSSILGHEKYDRLNAAYSFYNVATKTPFTELMLDALIAAKKKDFDVFNCLDVMENSSILKDLKFGIGDGHLQYYLYNWACPEMPANKVGVVLL